MGNKELRIKDGNEQGSGKRAGVWLTPAVDIFETEEALTLVADLPGVGREKLQIGIDSDILTVEGWTTASGEALCREFAAGGYYRRFQLPDNLDLEKVAAVLRDGVLTVTLPKAAAARPKRIEVTVH